MQNTHKAIIQKLKLYEILSKLYKIVFSCQLKFYKTRFQLWEWGKKTGWRQEDSGWIHTVDNDQS